jgi:hypothetical protein
VLEITAKVTLFDVVSAVAGVVTILSVVVVSVVVYCGRSDAAPVVISAAIVVRLVSGCVVVSVAVADAVVVTVGFVDDIRSAVTAEVVAVSAHLVEVLAVVPVTVLT